MLAVLPDGFHTTQKKKTKVSAKPPSSCTPWCSLLALVLSILRVPGPIGSSASRK